MGAIVTGGSRGIGEALVLKLAELGYDIIINYVSDRSKELTEKLIGTIEEKYHVKGYGFRADVSNYEDCKRLVDEALEKFDGKIDVLVNNAGVASSNVPFTEIQHDEIVRIIQTNLMGTVSLCHLVIPHMVKRKGGNIVNLSSIGGLMGVPGQAEYCASKAGIIGLTRALAAEFGSLNIRVNSICPGMIWTDMIKNCKEDAVNALLKTIPLGKIGDVQDVANTLEYFIKNEYVTGQYISPNGGVFMP